MPRKKYSDPDKDVYVEEFFDLITVVVGIKPGKILFEREKVSRVFLFVIDTSSLLRWDLKYLMNKRYWLISEENEDDTNS